MGLNFFISVPSLEPLVFISLQCLSYQYSLLVHVEDPVVVYERIVTLFLSMIHRQKTSPLWIERTELAVSEPTKSSDSPTLSCYKFSYEVPSKSFILLKLSTKNNIISDRSEDIQIERFGDFVRVGNKLFFPLKENFEKCAWHWERELRRQRRR